MSFMSHIMLDLLSIWVFCHLCPMSFSGLYYLYRMNIGLCVCVCAHSASRQRKVVKQVGCHTAAERFIEQSALFTDWGTETEIAIHPSRDASLYALLVTFNAFPLYLTRTSSLLIKWELIWEGAANHCQCLHPRHWQHLEGYLWSNPFYEGWAGNLILRDYREGVVI